MTTILAVLVSGYDKVLFATLLFHDYRMLRNTLTEDVLHDVQGDANAIAELEREWEQLQDDRLTLRQIFPRGDSKVSLMNSVILILDGRKVKPHTSSLFTFIYNSHIIQNETKQRRHNTCLLVEI